MGAVKFEFDDDFDAGGAGRMRKKQLSQAEIDALRADAYLEGAKSAEARAVAACAAALGQVAAAVMTALEQLDAEGRKVRMEAAQIALVAGRALAGAALARFPEDEVLRAVDSAMARVPGEPALTVRVPQSIHAALEPRVAALAQERGFTGRILLRANAELAGADCRIEWNEGGAERSAKAITAEIEDILARAAASLTDGASPGSDSA